jgi:CheY-like chemotaxis protein
VIWNLLSNAVKFTPHGGRVEVVLENRDSHVGLAVSDTGQGISSAFLPHVFERFQQADATTTRRHGGLGLGLAIVRHIVELHGGSVRAESPGEGRGSVFTVRLPPLARAPAAGAQRHGRPPEAVAQLDPSRSLQGIRVAVVDDDPDSNEVVRVLLVSHGAEVEVAGSALQALALLRRWKADVLLSDIGMPSEDGYALLRKLRESDAPGSKPLPAIALTAYGSDRDRARLLAAGFEAHLPKPVDGGELVALVARLAAGTPAAGVCEQVLLVEDDADVAEGLRALLERPGRLVRVAHDGEAALAAAREEAPDVMLVDIGLPRMDGHTLAKRVREDRDLQHVVLVALTGYGGPEDRRAALAAGFHRHVVKPVGREVLEKLLGELARQRASGSAGS